MLAVYLPARFELPAGFLFYDSNGWWSGKNIFPIVGVTGTTMPFVPPKFA
jgi:hypothetical protein